jgi:hypothetical protein
MAKEVKTLVQPKSSNVRIVPINEMPWSHLLQSIRNELKVLYGQMNLGKNVISDNGNKITFLVH